MSKRAMRVWHLEPDTPRQPAQGADGQPVDLHIGTCPVEPGQEVCNAIYPIDVMPGWLKVIAHVNPLTYLVDGLRALMVAGSHSAFGLGADIGVQLGALVLLVLAASRLYPTVVR